MCSAGFAGAAADAFTLFDKFEEKLERFPDNLPRAVVELAKEWRSDRVLRRLEALLAVSDKEHGFIVSGNGRSHRARRRHPRDRIRRTVRAGRGARALTKHTQLEPKDIVRKALEIAGEICIYTNTNITVLEL